MGTDGVPIAGGIFTSILWRCGPCCLWGCGYAMVNDFGVVGSRVMDHVGGGLAECGGTSSTYPP